MLAEQSRCVNIVHIIERATVSAAREIMPPRAIVLHPYYQAE